VSPSAKLQPRAVLLVDRENRHSATTRWFLGSFGFAVEVVRTAEEALARFDPAVHDVVITAGALPAMSGTELAHIIKLRSSSTPVVLLSEAPPDDPSCFNWIIEDPANALAVKEAVDRLLAGRPK